MKILQNEPLITLLTPKEELVDALLRIERAGRTCYQSEKGEITLDTARKFIGKLIKSGHESVLEHSLMTVKFGNVSRGLTHELVRHRLASYSQESTRYVDYKGGFDVVAPPDKAMEQQMSFFMAGIKVTMTPKDMFETVEQFYQVMRSHGWKSEDARQILPTGLVSEIVISANYREWRHVFKRRLPKEAHWEIREVMTRLLGQVKTLLSPVFDDVSGE